MRTFKKGTVFAFGETQITFEEDAAVSFLHDEVEPRVAPLLASTGNLEANRSTLKLKYDEYGSPLPFDEQGVKLADLTRYEAECFGLLAQYDALPPKKERKPKADKKNYRSARSGQFVKKEVAKKNPSSTVGERRTPKLAKKGEPRKTVTRKKAKK